MKVLLNHRGFTLIEMTIALVIGSMVIFGIASLTYMASVSCESVSTQTFTDMDAVNAMNRIVNDVRESKSVELVSANWMRGTFPVRTADGRYNRTQSDPNSRYDYYLGNSDGTYSTTGSYIWRKNANGSTYKLASGVRSLVFESDTPRSIQITVSMETAKRGKPFRCELTERVVYLRNY